MSRLGIRSRLLLAALLPLAVAITALLVIGNVLLAVRVRDERSAALRARSEAELASLTIKDGRIDTRESPVEARLDRSGWLVEGGVITDRPSGSSARVEQDVLRLARGPLPAEAESVADLWLRAQAVRDPGSGRTLAVAVVATSEEALESLRRDVLVGSLTLGLVFLLAGALAIRSALGGALRPVARMTAQARDWSAHDLDQRFGLGPPRDELTALAATLDDLLARVAALRRHERRFTGELAHELRTPLAALRGRAELAANAPADAQRDALSAIVDQSQLLAATIDGLIAAARHDGALEGESADLVEVARGFDGLEPPAPAAPLPRAEGSLEVLRRAVAPLVDNARRHAATRVWAEAGAGDGHVWLAIRDDGPGPVPELGERIFDPGVSDAVDGAGLGLPLARRIARACGGDVELGPGPGGDFVLRLPALR